MRGIYCIQIIHGSGEQAERTQRDSRIEALQILNTDITVRYKNSAKETWQRNDFFDLKKKQEHSVSGFKFCGDSRIRKSTPFSGFK